MNASMKNYDPKALRYVWSKVKHGGTNGVAITLGTVPDQFIAQRLDVVCVKVLVGVNATLSVGDTDTNNDYLSTQAITALDTVGKTVGASLTSKICKHTANQKNFNLLINTADLTAGNLEFYLTGFVPVLDVTTLSGAS
jgi:hypothetical protein